MPRKTEVGYDDPAVWLAYAEADFARARTDVEGAMPWNYCFDAQQTAEKALKAVLVSRGLPVPWTHDIDELIRGLRKGGVSVPDALDDADELSDYAARARYPGPFLVKAADRERAVPLAGAVLEWAKKEVARKGGGE